MLLIASQKEKAVCIISFILNTFIWNRKIQILHWFKSRKKAGKVTKFLKSKLFHHQSPVDFLAGIVWWMMKLESLEFSSTCYNKKTKTSVKVMIFHFFKTDIFTLAYILSWVNKDKSNLLRDIPTTFIQIKIDVHLLILVT